MHACRLCCGRLLLTSVAGKGWVTLQGSFFLGWKLTLESTSMRSNSVRYESSRSRRSSGSSFP